MKNDGTDPQIIWIEELVEVAERSASAPVFALLKREDERFVTMQAYENPAFVEDIVRNTALSAAREDARVAWFRVHAENQESIHNHDAFAQSNGPIPEMSPRRSHQSDHDQGFHGGHRFWEAGLRRICHLT